MDGILNFHHLKEISANSAYCFEDLNLFECRSCPFKTHLKVNLKNHVDSTHRNLQIDHNLTELHRVKSCEKCHLQTHSILVLMSHTCKKSQGIYSKEEKSNPDAEKPSTVAEVKWWQCVHCSYKTKIANHVKRHIASVHRNEWFICGQCPYGTKNKYALIKHNLQHTDPSKIKWLQCDLCPYKSTSKNLLASHVIHRHKTFDENDWFRCTHCPYKGKCKSSLELHRKRMHTSSDEMQWFQCEQCPFKTKTNKSLRVHTFRKHTPAEEVKWYECDQCTFKTKVCRGSLMVHMARMHNLRQV